MKYLTVFAGNLKPHFARRMPAIKSLKKLPDVCQIRKIIVYSNRCVTAPISPEENRVMRREKSKMRRMLLC